MRTVYVAAVERAPQRVAAVDERLHGLRVAALGAGAQRLEHPLARGEAKRGLVVGGRVDPDRDEHDQLLRRLDEPSATASSTPCAIPSCAAPHVIVWWCSSSAVALFIINVGGKTGS